MKTIIVILASLLILPAVCSAQEGDLAAEVRELMKTIIVILASLLILPAVCSAQEGDLAAEVRELRAKLERLEKKMTDEDWS